MRARTLRRNWNKRKWNCAIDKRNAGNSKAKNVLSPSLSFSCSFHFSLFAFKKRKCFYKNLVEKRKFGASTEYKYTAFWVTHKLSLMNVDVRAGECKNSCWFAEKLTSGLVFCYRHFSFPHTYCIGAKWLLLKSITAVDGCQAIIVCFQGEAAVDKKSTLMCPWMAIVWSKEFSSSRNMYVWNRKSSNCDNFFTFFVLWEFSLINRKNKKCAEKFCNLFLNHANVYFSHIFFLIERIPNESSIFIVHFCRKGFVLDAIGVCLLSLHLFVKSDSIWLDCKWHSNSLSWQRIHR